MIACRKSFTDTLLELARQDKDIVAVTTDARGSVTLGDFAKELPAQFVECGIAEQDAVGIYGAQNETYIEGWEKKTSNLLIYKRLCKI